MTLQERFQTPPTELYQRPRRRLFSWSSVGLSSLALKIIAVSLAGLAALLFFTLYHLQLRTTVADAHLESLLVQSDAIATIVSGDETAGAVPLVRLEVQQQERGVPPNNAGAAQTAAEPVLGTVIDRNRVDRLFAEVLEGTVSRAQIFGTNGALIADSRFALRTRSDVTSAHLPSLTTEDPSLIESVWNYFAGFLSGPTTTVSATPSTALPAPPATPSAAAVPSEVTAALGGVKTAEQRSSDAGDITLSVATPLLNASGDVIGAVRVSSPPGLIIDLARDQELAIVRVFLVAGLVAIVISFVLAASILRPIRRLARAAEHIKDGGGYVPMPEIRDSSEIGDLSRVLHEMTLALYSRIDAIEAFAGEVAHELKNPLTSLRSAVETLPLARKETSRDKLLAIIEHDVRRIDRLISDISDASKLDAELNRHRHERFDLIRLLQTVVGAQAELANDRNQTVKLVVRSSPQGFLVVGNDSRLGQVFTNLIDNARSFTPANGSVTVTAQRFANFIEVVVDDEGPGIDEAVMERIFERFYTDRSEQQSFGNNSGLGLAISRQIIEAHNGEIFAENRYRTTLSPERNVAGARFTVRLPVGSVALR
ncbi:stimulus-sensing domain-containing protein [Acuticoccus kandeliae]|uniref:stimulus-sensing domain-containing protein n=1 Tax=Acuticoccus kandeliae TaxID=2073160 RepID=UPI000D3E96CA|nr:stimulus-sensing domain-containing protein [Acuticoccus kandeliae]